VFLGYLVIAITIVVVDVSTIIEERKRLSFTFMLVHTSHLQAINGTPCDVPVPKNVIFKYYNIAKPN
jgi:hypothetical protein